MERVDGRDVPVDEDELEALEEEMIERALALEYEAFVGMSLLPDPEEEEEERR